jgi:hypothetical protein
MLYSAQLLSNDYERHKTEYNGYEERQFYLRRSAIVVHGMPGRPPWISDGRVKHKVLPIDRPGSLTSTKKPRRCTFALATPGLEHFKQFVIIYYHDAD